MRFNKCLFSVIILIVIGFFCPTPTRAQEDGFRTVRVSIHSLPPTIFLDEQGVKHWKQDRNSFYYEILDKWLYAEESRRVIPQWLIVLLVISGGVSVLLFIWTRMLRVQVRRRTWELQERNKKLAREIHERRKVEAALQDLEEFFHRITMENILDPVFITDDDGNFTFICANVPHILGYSMEDMRALGKITTLVGDDLFSLEELDTRGAIWNIERTMIAKNGSERIFLITVKRVSIKGGTVLYICRDITERKRAEEEINKTRQDLQRLSLQLLHAQEMERRKISQELHDEIGQALTAMRINLATIKKAWEPDCPSVIGESMEETMTLIDQTLEQIRELSLDLRPPMLDDLGLIPTLRWYINRYAKRLNIDVTFDTMALEERLHSEMETTFYRVIQEALTNVARHTQASRVRVSLKRKASTVTACVEDNGQGFDRQNISQPNAPMHGVGLLGIRERTTFLGGTVQLHSQPGQGTRLEVEIPI